MPYVLVAIAAAAGLALIAVAVVSHGGITWRDLQLAGWLHAHPSTGWIALMRVTSAVNSVAGVGLMTCLLALWLWRRHHHGWLEALGLAIPGVMVLNAVLKQIFARPRPHFAVPWTSLSSYSFPSGHVSQSTVFYGFLAAMFITRACNRVRSGAIAAAAAVMVILVAGSRLYLGAHYLTDVVAALFEGIAWLALCRIAMAWRPDRSGPAEPRR